MAAEQVSPSLIDDEARALIGAELERSEGVVVRRDFQRWAAAVGDHNPLYFDAGFARAHGHRDVVMPPMYIQHVTTGVVRLDQLRPDGIPEGSGSGALALPGCPRRMAGGEEIRFLAPAYPGDELTAVRRVAGLEQKSGRSGPFILVRLTSTYTRSDGELIAESTRFIIARPPAERPAGQSAGLAAGTSGRAG
jgi:acyl dehydratase